MLYADFHGGLNTRGNPHLLSDHECRDALNVQSLTAGGITKRNGLLTLATPATAFDSLYALEATAPMLLVGHGGTALYSVNGAGAITSRKTAVSSSARWEWVQSQPSGGQGPLYGMNGTDTPQQWDGVAATMSDWTATSGTVPNGKYVLLHQNFVFVAGTAANPSRLYWCQIVPGTGTDPRQWPAPNVIDLDPNDGDQITGLGKAGSLLLVFKRHKVFAVTDPTTGANRRISDSIGCIANRSIAETPQGTFFLAESGVWTTNGSTLTFASDIVAPTVTNMTFGATAAAVYWNQHYYLSNGSQTLDYDITQGSWWLHSIGVNQWTPWHPGGVPGLYGANTATAIVSQCFAPNVWQDNGVNFQWYWRGPWQSPSFYRRRLMATPYYRKRLTMFRADGSGTVDYSLATDYGGGEVLRRSDLFATPSSGTFGVTGTFGVDGTFGGGSTVPRATVYSLGVARTFSTVFGALSPNPGSVFEYTLYVIDRRD
jgi:hypothetical protein